MNDDIVKLCEAQALGEILAEEGNYTYETFLAALEDGEIPSDAIVCDLYDHMDAEELTERLETQFSICRSFAKQVMEMLGHDTSNS